MSIARPVLAAVILIAPLCAGRGSAWAQSEPAPEPSGAVPADTPPSADPAAPIPGIDEPDVPEPEPSARFGIGFRGRFLFFPQSFMKIFVDHGTGMASFLVGGEVIRRKGNLDMVFAAEYASVAPDDGWYLEKGNNPNNFTEYPSYEHFDGLSIIGLDATFLWHTDLTSFLQFRWGVGVGVAILLGNIEETKASGCMPGTTADQLDDPNQCTLDRTKTGDKDLPSRIWPIVDLLGGLRFKVVDDLSIGVELGLRDGLIFTGGVDIGYFF